MQNTLNSTCRLSIQMQTVLQAWKAVREATQYASAPASWQYLRIDSTDGGAVPA